MPQRVPPHPEQRRCPWCGSAVWSDNRHAWCVRDEQVGKKNVKPCQYGVKSFIAVQQHREGL